MRLAAGRRAIHRNGVPDGDAEAFDLRSYAGFGTHIAIAIDIADALDAAEGIIHRDKKPREFVRNLARHVKILTSGWQSCPRSYNAAAVALSAMTPQPLAVNEVDLTGPGAALDDPYMSPEQVRAKEWTHERTLFRSASSHEMVTGTMPFRGKVRGNPQRNSERRVPAVRLNPDVPENWKGFLQMPEKDRSALPARLRSALI
jgi:hypothetical protein